MESFKTVVDLFANGDDEGMGELVNWVKFRSVTDEDIVYLTETLANSGDVLAFSEQQQTSDVASTGGPSSLSTLLCPLYLRELNVVVPKLGVPGRPAGGIDVLGQLSGYSVQLSRDEIERVLSQCGYVHILADQNYAPLDAALFAYRQKAGAQNVPPLAIASLLSKKMAMGLKCVGLDVRVAEHGNFGKNWEEARLNARRFCRVAKLAGIRATCFLTDGSIPYQPYIGRSESLVALSEVFSGTSSGSLATHAKMCFEMASSTVTNEKVLQPNGSQLLHHFEANLVAQGCHLAEFRSKVTETIEGHSYNISSTDEGFLHVDLGKLRNILVGLQKSAVKNIAGWSDPCGVILRKAPGEYIKNGDDVASLRSDEGLYSTLKEQLAAALNVSPVPVIPKGLEVIR